MTKRKEQALRTKANLLEIAIEMIQKHGYDQVKIKDICQEAGVSVGAFYHHFKNKADIVVAMYADCDSYFEKEVIPKFEDCKDVEAVCQYLDHQMNYGRKFGIDLVIQIYRAQITDGADFFLSMERSLPQGLIHILERLQKLEILTSETSAFQMAQELLIISRGILYNWAQSKGNYDINALNWQIIRHYLIGYQKA